MLKKYRWHILGGFLFLIAVSYVVCDRASLQDKYNYWRGAYTNLSQITKANEKIKLGTIIDLQAQIKGLNKAGEESKKKIAELEKGKVQSDAALMTAREGWAALSVEAQAKLVALDRAWANKFDILSQQYKEQKKINFDLLTKYDKQVEISATYKALWEGQTTLASSLKQGLNLADKRIASLNRRLKMNRIIEVGLIVAGAYLALKK